jgi:hypothetical protein
MVFSYLSDDIFGKQIIPAAWQVLEGITQDPSDGGKYYVTNPDGSKGGLYGLLQDEIAEQPNFDKSKAVYTPTDQAGSSVKVDNRNGLNPNATVHLAYSAETGATATHDSTNSITAGVSEEVDVGFPDIAGSKTTFSLSGTFSYSDGTSTSKTTTVTNTVDTPVDNVPTGKIYEATIFYTQETLKVPYTLTVYVPDSIQEGSNFEFIVSSAWFPDESNDSEPSTLFDVIRTSNAAGADSKLYSYGTVPDRPTAFNSAGVVTLSGTAVMSNFGEAKTQVHDVTPQTGLTAVVDETAGVGVHHILGDGGESFTASKFDDWIEGGAGDDRIYLKAGDDRAEGGGGDDRIQALDGGHNVLDGGDGDDHLLVLSGQAYNQLRGGTGGDLIEAYAPQSILTGGEGDDIFVLDARSAGSVIVGAEGHDKLEFAAAGRVVLERSGADLFIHADGDAGSYDPAADLVWLDFFAGDGEVNGLGGAGMTAQLDLGLTPVYSPETGQWSAVFGDA